MNRIFRFLPRMVAALAAILLLFPIAGAIAQDESPQQWYFALADNGHQIVAFNAEGNSRVFIESDQFYTTGGRKYRLAPDRAFVRLNPEDSETTTVAMLTPDEVQVFVFPEALAHVMESPVPPQIWMSGSHLFMFTIPIELATPMLHFNLDTLEVSLLSPLAGSRGGAGISEDGRYIRFVEQESRDSPTWNYVEYDMEADTSRIFYTVETQSLTTSHSTDGSKWIYLNLNQDESLRQYFLIDTNGESELLSEQSVSDLENLRDYQVVQDHISIVNPACLENCTLELIPLDNRAMTLQYTLPALEPIYIMLVMDDNRVFAFTEQSLWILKPDGSNTYLGDFSPRAIINYGSVPVSPNRKWLLAVDSIENTSTYRVWDISAEQIIFENPIPPSSVQVTFFENGFIADESEGSAPLYMYFNGTGDTFRLPAGNREYFDILPDGDVLYADIQESAIYRYNPASDTSVRILEDVEFIHLNGPI